MPWKRCGGRISRSRPTGPAEPRGWVFAAVGRAGASPEAGLFQRYAARLKPRPTLIEVPDARGSPGEIRRREGERILASVPAGAWLVALDLGGTSLGSEALAGELARWAEAGRVVAFAIGGAEGLDAGVLAAAAQRLSLGKLTWPHLLARAMLAEALYRAQSIAAGHPYHRGWRPE
jgi:23S rRNA (pseudouridine1915-N3)-methyltransferase